MSMFVDLLLVAAVTIYIVDLSGFTDAWRSALARRMHIPESNLRPSPSSHFQSDKHCYLLGSGHCGSLTN